MKSIVLPLLAAACLLPMQTTAQEAPASRGCPLRPEALALRESCARGEESTEVCVWVSVVEGLLAGRREEAAEKLTAAFSLSGELATRILAAAGIYVLPLADNSCPKENVAEFFSDIWTSGALQEAARGGDNVSTALMMRLMGFHPKALKRVAAQMGEAGGPEASRALDSLALLLRRGGAMDQLGPAISGDNPVLTGQNATGSITALKGSFSPELAEFGALLGEVDAALELIARGKIADARRSLERVEAKAADDRAKGLAWARAGWGFLQLLRLEDGLAAFARARTWLEKSPPSDKIGRNALYLVAEGQKLAFAASGLANEVSTLPPDPEMGPLLELISGAMAAGSDPEKLEKLLPKIFQKVISGEIQFDAIQPFMLATEAVFPMLANFGPAQLAGAPPASGGGLPFFKEMELLLMDDAAAALDTWRETSRDNSHLNQLVGGVLVALVAWRKGDLENARTTLVGAVEVLERHLAAQRIDEMARSPFVDNLSSLIYFAATEITAATGQPREAFQLAERGRAFTLRRLLGAPRSAGADLDLSAEEKKLVREIARIERGPAGGQAALPELQRRFENARLDRLLASTRGAAPPFPVPASVETLQGEVLGADETLLAYYPGLEGKLWLWRITRTEAELSTLKLPEAASFRCLAQMLRWQESGEEPRRSARARGADVLLDCPGQPAGVDPAAVLYDELIAPLESQLPAGRRLILVPHGELHLVPFAALRNPKTGRRLAETYELAAEPSADALALLRRIGGVARAGHPETRPDPGTRTH